MQTLFVTMGFFIVALVFMGVVLHLVKYKKKPSGCCGGAEHVTQGSCCGEHTESCDIDQN